MISRSILRLDTLSVLRAQPVADGALALMVGKDTRKDGRGGFYQWDPTSTAADDSSTWMNVIASVRPGQVTGRWIRIFQRIRVLPQGFLVLNGGVKTLYFQGVIGPSNGEIVVNLTEENTANGTAVFSEIWEPRAMAIVNASGEAETVVLNRVVMSPGLKSVTMRFVRGNPQSLGMTLGALLGILITPFRYAAPGTPVTIVLTGV